MLRKTVLVMAMVALVASLLPLQAAQVAAAAPGPKCAKADHKGGDWTSFGSDLSNTRSQPNETELTPESAALILPKWTFSVAGAGGLGNFQSTPVISDG